MGEAGANCVQQVAFTLADGIEYIKAAISAGLKIDDFAPRLSFFFGIGMDLFMNVAMLRAARYLWSEAVSDLAHRIRNHWRCVPTARPQAGA